MLSWCSLNVLFAVTIYFVLFVLVGLFVLTFAIEVAALSWLYFFFFKGHIIGAVMPVLFVVEEVLDSSADP